MVFRNLTEFASKALSFCFAFSSVFGKLLFRVAVANMSLLCAIRSELCHNWNVRYFTLFLTLFLDQMIMSIFAVLRVASTASSPLEDFCYPSISPIADLACLADFDIRIFLAGLTCDRCRYVSLEPIVTLSCSHKVWDWKNRHHSPSLSLIETFLRLNGFSVEYFVVV